MQRFLSNDAYIAIWFAIIGLLLTNPIYAQVSVLTQHNDLSRTGQNLQESVLTQSNVKVGTFGKLFTDTVDGQIYAQPLYVPNVNILHGGVSRNILFVATAHDKIYAFDADGGNSGKNYWGHDLGPYVPSSVIGTTNILNGVGITSTPVIDPVRGVIYIVAKVYNKAANTQSYMLHALDIATGNEKLGGPVTLSASVPGSGIDAVGGMVSFNPAKQLQRAGLLLLNGTLYIGFGSHEDYDPYHGWVMAYNASNLQQVGAFCTTPNGKGGGVWQGGQGLASDGTSVYFLTGNGTSDIQTGGKNASECFIRLQLMNPGGLQLQDWFLVHEFGYLNDEDLDLGSAGTILLPGTQWIVGGGKEGMMFLTNRNNLGHWGGSTSSDPQIQQEYSAWFGNVMGAPVIWNSATNGLLLFVWAAEDVLRCYKFDPTAQKFVLTPYAKGSVYSPAGISCNAALSISANGESPGTGILWATSPTNDADASQVVGTLYAINPLTGTPIYNSNQAAADNLGNWAKFCPPTVANGKVYVGTCSNQIAAYGLLPTPLAPTKITGQPGNTKAYLTWQPGQYAATYSILRATTSTGPFTTLAKNIANPIYVDTNLLNGTSYYYEIVSTNNLGNSAPSAVTKITPSGSVANGTIISINFVGGGDYGYPDGMASNEQAGVVPVVNWNNGYSPNGTLNLLADNLGYPSGAILSWNSSYTGSENITEAAGNYRLMKGYLAPDHYGSAFLYFSNIPQDFVSHGYSVYVYTQGDTNENREGAFTIGSTVIDAFDPANSVFNGTFTKASGTNGNYVVFTGLKQSSFTLYASPLKVGTSPSAPVNGVQIVRNP